jgi:hypothetical protein
MPRITAPALALAASGLIAGPAHAETNIMFILDGSNSMWGQIEGTAKIETAKSVLNDSLSGLSGDVVPGLMIYGHRQKDDCSDVQLVAPFGSASVSEIRSAVSGVTPRGKTPIATSLKAAGDAFAGREEENNNILLISDGIETCEGDPCAVAGELVQRGINVRVHVVGFDVDAETRAQLQCIADRGNGQYFDAKNAADFKDAVEQARQTAQAKEPEPEPEPKITEYFRDDFDGENLSEAWQVDAPDPEEYIVEDGNLLLVDGDHSYPLGSENQSNLIRLSGIDLPKGDWTATMIVDMHPQTAREIISFGLYESPESYIAAEIYASGDGNYGWGLTVRMLKQTGSEQTKAEERMAALGCNVCGADRQFQNFTASLTMPIELKLIKEGRSYYAMAKLSGADDQWITTGKLTSLRAKGDLSISIGQYQKVDGETAAKIDLVKIEVEN